MSISSYLTLISWGGGLVPVDDVTTAVYIVVPLDTGLEVAEGIM